MGILNALVTAVVDLPDRILSDNKPTTTVKGDTTTITTKDSTITIKKTK